MNVRNHIKICLFAIAQLISPYCIGQLANQNLAKSFASARVVLLGEPTHGEGNVIAAKLELVKFLHDSLGFSVLAFESGFYDVYVAQQNLDITASSAAVKVCLQEAVFPIWTESKSFQPFFDYLFQHKGKLTVAGFDNQLTGSNSINNLCDSMIGFLQSYYPLDGFRIDKDLLEEVIDAFGNEYAFPEEISYPEFQQQMDKVLRLLQKISRRSKLSATEKEMAWVYKLAVANLSALGKDYWDKKGSVLNKETFKALDSNPRDSMMAENLLALMQLYPNQKIICWGAGTHFINSTGHLNNEELREYRSMGSILKKRLGEEAVFNLTFVSGAGRYGLPGEADKAVPQPATGSIEADLTAIGRDSFVLLKTSPYTNDSFVSYCLEYQPIKANWSRLFDAFIYLRHFTSNNFVGQRATAFTPIQQTESEQDVPAQLGTVPGSLWKGIVLDAANRAPLPFSTILDTEGNYLTQTDDRGYFHIHPDKQKATYKVNQIGYRSATVSSSSTDTIFLQSQDLQLAAVTVLAGKIKGVDIFKKVLEHLPENYGKYTFKQTAFVNFRWTNFDSLILDRDLLVHNYINLNIQKRPWFDVRERRTNKFSVPLAGQVGGFTGGSSRLREDFVRERNMFKGKRYRGLSFDSVRTYTDASEGQIYKLFFHAKKLSFRYTRDFFTASFSGVLHVKKTNYAILKIETRLERKTEQLKVWAKKHYGRGDSIWIVSPESEIFLDHVSYSRSPGDNKYYVRFAHSRSCGEGLLLSTGQPLKVIADYSYYNADTVQVIAEPSKLPFETFKTTFNIPYRPEFWDSFSLPEKTKLLYPNPSILPDSSGQEMDKR